MLPVNITPHIVCRHMYYGDRDETLDIKERGQLSYSRFKLGGYNENENRRMGDSYKVSECFHLYSKYRSE